VELWPGLTTPLAVVDRIICRISIFRSCFSPSAFCLSKFLGFWIDSSVTIFRPSLTFDSPVGQNKIEQSSLAQILGLMQALRHKKVHMESLRRRENKSFLLVKTFWSIFVPFGLLAW
jgi:hypothetical protein